MAACIDISRGSAQRIVHDSQQLKKFQKGDGSEVFQVGRRGEARGARKVPSQENKNVFQKVSKRSQC